MNEFVLVIKAIVIGACPHVTLLVKEELHLISRKCQYPDIKFPLVVEQRLLNVLLHHPLLI